MKALALFTVALQVVLATPVHKLEGGSWAGPCEPMPFKDFRRTFFTFDSGLVTQHQRFFADPECSTAFESQTYSTGQYQCFATMTSSIHAIDIKLDDPPVAGGPYRQIYEVRKDRLYFGDVWAQGSVPRPRHINYELFWQRVPTPPQP